ncbi:MAG TPA: hypothetical protein VFE57_05730, partial [Cyclobacteriaceae bacterium]|nr:hypothetical protein [Cyclobacteriaceae bacterium]
MSFSINEYPPIGNGGGTCKTLEDVKKFCQLSIPIIEIGSITKKVRFGNEGDTFHAGNDFTLNSLGLPNGGMPYYEENLSEMTNLIRVAGKKSIVNIVGFEMQEYGDLTRFAFAKGADYVVNNYGCPNVWVNKGDQKDIVSHDFETLKQTTISILAKNTLEGCQGRIGIKLSPLYPSDIAKVAEFLNTLALVPLNNVPYVGFVTTTNTIPNCYEEEDGCSVITPGEGLAGMAGPAVGPMARGQIRQFRKLLDQRIHIVGVGGISTGEDVAKMLKCG